MSAHLVKGDIVGELNGIKGVKKRAYQNPSAKNEYSTVCVIANGTIIRRIGVVESAVARSNSRVYLSKTEVSIASDDTVRMAETASDAIEELSENRLEILASMLASIFTRAYPDSKSGGRPPKMITSPSFHPYAKAKMAQEAMATIPRMINAIVMLINSSRDRGYESARLAKAPVVFSGRSKNCISCLRIQEIICLRYLWFMAWNEVSINDDLDSEVETYLPHEIGRPSDDEVSKQNANCENQEHQSDEVGFLLHFVAPEFEHFNEPGHQNRLAWERGR